MTRSLGCVQGWMDAWYQNYRFWPRYLSEIVARICVFSIKIGVFLFTPALSFPLFFFFPFPSVPFFPLSHSGFFFLSQVLFFPLSRSRSDLSPIWFKLIWPPKKNLFSFYPFSFYLRRYFSPICLPRSDIRL